MNKGDTITVNPFGCDNIHVGIIDKITNKSVQCKEWYGIKAPNLVTGSVFSKDVVKKVNSSVFYEAKKLYKLETRLAEAINGVFDVADLPENLISFDTILDKITISVDIDLNNKYFVYDVNMVKL